MNCKDAHKNLIFLAEKELTPDKESELLSHLATCKSCAIMYSEIKASLGIIEQEKSIDTNPFFFTRVEQRLENSITSNKKPVFQKVLQPVLVGFSILIFVLAGIQFGNQTFWRNISFDNTGIRQTEIQLLADEYVITEGTNYNTYYLNGE